MTTVCLHSGDADWAVVQRDQIFSLLDNTNTVVGEIELQRVAAELPIWFCNGNVLAIQHEPDTTTVTALTIPSLTPAAQLQLPGRWLPKCVTGQRIALLADSGLKIAIVRVAARALAVIEFDIGAPAEFVLALDKQQVLVGSGKKLEAFDALTGRPLMRVNVNLPAAPRNVGSAQGHLWITRPGADSLTVVRLSDGRVFPHVIGAEPLSVYSDLHSPYVVIATERGLVRLQCFSHTIVALGTPPASMWALQPNGNDTVLLGMAANDAAPWRAGLANSNAVVTPAQTMEAVVGSSPAQSAQGNVALVRTMRPPPRSSTSSSWRSQLAAVALEPGNLAAQRAAVPADARLLQWCLAAGCSDIATSALVVLYARYLQGAGPLPLREAARCLGDHDAAWHEVLGHGDAAGHGLLEYSLAGLTLTLAGSRFFDDCAPSQLLRRGTGPRHLGPGVYWSPLGTDLAATLQQLNERLGSLDVVAAATVSSITEAYLHGATVVLPSCDAETVAALAKAPVRAAIVVLAPVQPWFVATILPQP